MRAWDGIAPPQCPVQSLCRPSDLFGFEKVLVGINGRCSGLAAGLQRHRQQKKKTCSCLAANDGFIYYSYDLLSYDDDEDDDDHDHDHDDDDHDARGVMIRHDAAALPLMQRPCH